MDFLEVDDWNEIIPNSAFQFTGNEIKAFITNYFNNYLFQLKGIKQTENNLLFALVEFSSLNMENLDGIGATYVYSSSSEKIAKQTLKLYHEHLNDLKDKGAKYVTEFSNWYDSGMFILERNDTLMNYQDRKFRQYWLDKGGDFFEKPRLELTENHKAPEEGFIEYLNNYAAKIIELLKLDSFPNTYIIAKPVYLLDDDNNKKPIGNYFIHIGLKEQINTSQIINFLHLFFLTWFKNHWNTIFSNFKEQLEEEQVSVDNFSRFELRINIEDNGSVSNRIGPANKYDFNTLLKQFFRRDKFHHNEEFVKTLREKTFPKIVHYLYNIKARNTINRLDFFALAAKVNGENIKNNSSGKIKDFVVSRYVITTAVLVFDFYFEHISKWYVKRDLDLQYQETEDNIDPIILKRIFQQARFLYIGKFNASKCISEIRTNILSSMSLFEIEILLSSETTINEILSKTSNPDDFKILNNSLNRISEIKTIVGWQDQKVDNSISS